jgi:hypothetical protein
MESKGRRALSRITLWCATLAAATALIGCGGSGDDGAAELAKQQELRAARAQAARDARQGAKIAELERRLDTANEGAPVSKDGSTPRPASAGSGEPPLLEGLWRGEAEIRYEDGKVDPFTQTIEIESLAVGSVSGYSEARQGSTTCHGPLTYEGFADGWHRFSSSEENTSECIDSSEVELEPDETGHLRYREVTDVSTSTGVLQRVR